MDMFESLVDPFIEVEDPWALITPAPPQKRRRIALDPNLARLFPSPQVFRGEELFHLTNAQRKIFINFIKSNNISSFRLSQKDMNIDDYAISFNSISSSYSIFYDQYIRDTISYNEFYEIPNDLTSNDPTERNPSIGIEISKKPNKFRFEARLIPSNLAEITLEKFMLPTELEIHRKNEINQKQIHALAYHYIIKRFHEVNRIYLSKLQILVPGSNDKVFKDIRWGNQKISKYTEFYLTIENNWDRFMESMGAKFGSSNTEFKLNSSPLLSNSIFGTEYSSIISFDTPSNKAVAPSYN